MLAPMHNKTCDNNVAIITSLTLDVVSATDVN